MRKIMSRGRNKRDFKRKASYVNSANMARICVRGGQRHPGL